MTSALSSLLSLIDKTAAQSWNILLLKERVRRLEQMMDKLDDTMYSLIYINQNPDCIPEDKEAAFCIDILSKFPVSVPLDLIKSNLNGILILDKETITGYKADNNDIRKTKDVLRSIVVGLVNLIGEFEKRNPGLLEDLLKTIPADFKYPEIV